MREFSLRICLGFDRVKNKKQLSEASDEQKTGKNGFPRPRMSRKRRKSTFGHGRRVKNNKNGVSAPAEKRKNAKT
ncbi:MAG: hypothetical protein ACFN4W_10955, partial [Segatella oris]